MIQSLLADRFKLGVSHETKELPVYALVIAKNGPKLQEAKPGDTYPNGMKGLDGRPALGDVGGIEAMNGPSSIDSVKGFLWRLLATVGASSHWAAPFWIRPGSRATMISR